MAAHCFSLSLSLSSFLFSFCQDLLISQLQGCMHQLKPSGTCQIEGTATATGTMEIVSIADVEGPWTKSQKRKHCHKGGSTVVARTTTNSINHHRFTFFLQPTCWKLGYFTATQHQQLEKKANKTLHTKRSCQDSQSEKETPQRSSKVLEGNVASGNRKREWINMIRKFTPKRPKFHRNLTVGLNRNRNT